MNQDNINLFLTYVYSCTKTTSVKSADDKSRESLY